MMNNEKFINGFWKMLRSNGKENWGEDFFEDLEKERAMKEQKPIVNAWYVSLAGKLYNVRMLDYNAGELTNVLVRDLEGSTVLVSI